MKKKDQDERKQENITSTARQRLESHVFFHVLHRVPGSIFKRDL